MAHVGEEADALGRVRRDLQQHPGRGPVGQLLDVGQQRGQQAQPLGPDLVRVRVPREHPGHGPGDHDLDADDNTNR